MSEYVIETKGLTKEYNGKRSVSDLNLHIKKEESMVFWVETERVRLQL